MNLSRRDLLKMLGAIALVPTIMPSFAFQNSGTPGYFTFVNKARQNGWLRLNISQLMEKIALEFIDKPYVGGTLDISDTTETCIVNLDKFDCVTYFETVLGMARAFKFSKFDYEDLLAQVQFTRYRDGKIDGYTSRLHYTADWIYDNIKKRVVRDITKDLGGEKIQFNTYFMSENPDKYRALAANPELVPIIKSQEEEINKRDYYYIPKEKVTKQIDKIQTCDIIAITTSIKGLDYAHTGFAYKNEDGEVKFLHASSQKKKVVLDTYLYKYLNSNNKHTGITVLRAI